MTFVCGGPAAPSQALRILTELRHCCMGSAEHGPADCTCWEPVYDLEQAEPDRSAEPATRAAMCADCAYRPDSPERQGDDRYRPNEATADAPFWCHQGLRKPIAWRHRLGITVECDTDAYAPPVIAGVPYKADGSPGERCAGWAAHHREQGQPAHVAADIIAATGA